MLNIIIQLLFVNGVSYTDETPRKLETETCIVQEYHFMLVVSQVSYQVSRRVKLAFCPCARFVSSQDCNSEDHDVAWFLFPQKHKHHQTNLSGGTDHSH